MGFSEFHWGDWTITRGKGTYVPLLKVVPQLPPNQPDYSSPAYGLSFHQWKSPVGLGYKNKTDAALLYLFSLYLSPSSEIPLLYGSFGFKIALAAH